MKKEIKNIEQTKNKILSSIFLNDKGKLRKIFYPLTIVLVFILPIYFFKSELYDYWKTRNSNQKQVEKDDNLNIVNDSGDNLIIYDNHGQINNNSTVNNETK
jgi:hypothetical protein